MRWLRDRRERRAARKPPPPIRPWTARQWPLLIVLGTVVLSIGTVFVVDFRPGMLLFAGAVLLAAAFRLVLPTRRAGLLVVRGRTVDFITLVTMGTAAFVLALAVPGTR